MAPSRTLLATVFHNGGASSRYGDFVLVKLASARFLVTAQDFRMTTNWARGRISSGYPVRDCATFTDRFETLLARRGCGLASRGSRPLLRRMVEGIRQMNLGLDQWSIPANINESVEISRRARRA